MLSRTDASTQGLDPGLDRRSECRDKAFRRPSATVSLTGDGAGVILLALAICEC